MKQPFCILGRHGLIGGALEKMIGSNLVTSFPVKDTKVIYHFASTVHPPFEQNPEFHMNEIISSFLFLLPYCKEHNIRFIYPSSALVYEKDTCFTRTKKILELLASCYPNTLGLRIFPVYGPGEHRTVIAQFCRDMKHGRRPKIYGDGSQKRDFLYITDLVNRLVYYATSKDTGVQDIGPGNPVSFNEIVQLINDQLGTQILPIYIKKPRGYSQGIASHEPMKNPLPIAEGIKKVLESSQ